MAEIISLSRAKKARDKADAKAIAAENRVKFGRSKAEKAADRTESSTLERRLDSHKRDQDAD